MMASLKRFFTASHDIFFQTVIWGTDVNVGRVMDRFKRFLLNFKTNDLAEEPRLTTGRDIDPNQPLYLQKLDDMAASGSTSLEVNCVHLNAFHADLYQQLVAYPKEVIPACDSAAHQLFMEKHREVLLERPVQVRYLMLAFFILQFVLFHKDDTEFVE